MTPFWFWVAAGCAACAVAGFGLVRAVARALPAGSAPVAVRSVAVRSVAVRSVAVDSLPPVREAPPAVPPAPEAAPHPYPAPTAPEPDPAKLALWARQVKAGERKMSLATDGCRVTWDRRCKHGHPTWLVQLGYL
jgi:hypothetical protein